MQDGAELTLTLEGFAVYDDTPAGVVRRAIADGAFPVHGDAVKMVRAMLDSVGQTPAPRRLAGTRGGAGRAEGYCPGGRYGGVNDLIQAARLRSIRAALSLTRLAGWPDSSRTFKSHKTMLNPSVALTV